MHRLRHRTAAAAILSLALVCAGCNVLGVLAQPLGEPTEPAAYKGLAGQSCAVYVWVDRGVLIDWPDIRLNICSGVQNKLLEAQKADNKLEDLKGTTFPLTAAAIERFAESHPELEAEPIADIAPLLHVQRVIYVEVQSFQTRSPESIDLFRGSINALVKVLEVKDGKATTVFEDRNVTAIFPPKSTEEGAPDLGDEAVYDGTLKELTTDISVKFFAHPAEDE
jgi:hypothetical protein